MRTSRLELERAYLKHYTSPEILTKVKIEPNEELRTRANEGIASNPIIINQGRNEIMRNEPNQIKSS